MTKKWNVELRFASDSPLHEGNLNPAEIRALRERAVIEPAPRMPDLKKTPEEKATIRQMNLAAKHIFRFFGLPTVPLLEQRVHVVEPKTYERYHKYTANSGAYHRGGRIYIPRYPEQDHFIKKLAHEGSHEMSFVKALITAPPDAVSPLELNTYGKQSGYKIETSSDSFGLGFNEGITELCALGLRQIYCQLTKASPEQTEHIMSDISYPMQVAVLSEVASLLPAHEHGWSGMQQIIYGYLTGDQRVFKRLTTIFRGRGIPNALKILFAMGDSKEDGLKTAEELGLETAKKEIWTMLEENVDWE